MLSKLKEHWSRSTAVPSTTYDTTSSLAYPVTQQPGSTHTTNRHIPLQVTRSNVITTTPSQYVLHQAGLSAVPQTPVGPFKPSPLLRMANTMNLTQSQTLSPSRPAPTTLLFSPFGGMQGVEPDESQGSVDAQKQEKSVPVSEVEKAGVVVTHAAPHQILSYNPMGSSLLSPSAYMGPQAIQGLQPMVYPIAGPAQIIYDIYDVEDMVPYYQEQWRPIAFHYRSVE